MIRGYLTFTRKERFGVLFLLIVICVLFVLPYFFRPSVGQPDQAAYDKLKEGILKLESKENDSSQKTSVYDRYQKLKNDTADELARSGGENSHSEIFYFDPNTLNASEWHRMGLSDRIIQTILHYTEKGGRFHNAEDLKKLYGLSNSDYKRLLPYVRIDKAWEGTRTESKNNAKPSFNIRVGKKTDSFSRINLLNSNRDFVYGRKNFTSTDVNLADSADWTKLPGIGEKLASRIVHFREKLGGFYQVDQVGETFGLPDSSFQKIRPYLHINTFTLNQIDINTATKEVLQSHPYIRWQLAKVILEYRVQHGGFRSIDELLQVALMDSAKYEKLKPYLAVGGQ